MISKYVFANLKMNMTTKEVSEYLKIINDINIIYNKILNS